MMLYTDRFLHVEDYLAHLDPMMASISDPFVQGRYIGFIATSAVTAYELAVKDIFYAFADKKHSVLGNVTRARFFRLNGKIKLDDLKKEHVKSFGEDIWTGSRGTLKLLTTPTSALMGTVQKLLITTSLHGGTPSSMKANLPTLPTMKRSRETISQARR